MPFFSWVVMYHFTCMSLKIFKAIFEFVLDLSKEFIPVNLRISKVPSYWRWSLLLKSGSFSDVPSYSRTPLIRDSRVPIIRHY